MDKIIQINNRLTLFEKIMTINRMIDVLYEQNANGEIDDEWLYEGLEYLNNRIQAIKEILIYR